MSQIDITKKLIGLQGVIYKNIEENEKEIILHIELEQKEQICPCCGHKTSYIHDYREQKVKDIPFRGKQLTLMLRKRRYICKHCNKRFAEKNTFLPKYYRMTNRLSAWIINQLREVVSFSSVARTVNLSTPTIIRVFDIVSAKPYKLPKVLSIDEFKGNTNNKKYQAKLTDPVNHKVLDILPERTNTCLIKHFRSFDKSEREQVEYFVSDMYKPYKTLSGVYFNNATLITDKYHWIRQCIWALNKVRKNVQKKFSKNYRIYFKHSKELLDKPYNKLKDDQKRRFVLC